MSNYEVIYLLESQTIVLREGTGPFHQTSWPTLLSQGGLLADIAAVEVGRVAARGAVLRESAGVGVVVTARDGKTVTLHPHACASLLAHLLMLPRPKLLVDTREQYG